MNVSIVTPSFNQGQYLERTLSSVLDQDFEGLQYIVVDGGSTDGSKAILERYRGRLSHLIIENDRGQADALRKGFSLATGEILAFLNSDDALLPGALEFVSNFFADHPEIDAIYSHRIFLDENGRMTGVWILPPHSSYCMSRWDFIPQETCFWRKSLMERAGSIDPTFHFAIDYDLFVRMMKMGRFVRANRFLAVFRRHSQSKSTLEYETVGRLEVERVRQENRIDIRWYDQILKGCFGALIYGASFLFRVFVAETLRERAELGNS